VAAALGSESQEPGEPQEIDWAWVFYILCHEWHIPYSEIGKMTMLQVAHCLRITSQANNMGKNKLTRKDIETLKASMDKAFSN
jgi:hypothetical protein